MLIVRKDKAISLSCLETPSRLFDQTSLAEIWAVTRRLDNVPPSPARLQIVLDRGTLNPEIVVCRRAGFVLAQKMNVGRKVGFWNERKGILGPFARCLTGNKAQNVLNLGYWLAVDKLLGEALPLAPGNR
jgi:hypothetical protein